MRLIGLSVKMCPEDFKNGQRPLNSEINLRLEKMCLLMKFMFDAAVNQHVLRLTFIYWTFSGLKNKLGVMSVLTLVPVLTLHAPDAYSERHLARTRLTAKCPAPLLFAAAAHRHASLSTLEYPTQL